ncbi:MaoC family dehydratase [Quisquiliibacterium transsilvanicum]|uniref:Acyl dehydratase n=1 Tax=Quisquiliibacterium transsilvanicum TaxID=1549638 RepID=A0A7W8MAG1_9BURK|nr:MaoC family dehydratase [Quisquiliibacterium transsilvanicum]MBB5273325.1 acyl dehydratase [Quisquiliibacterium transsilvanicum]
MPIDLDCIGREAGPAEVAWTSRDAMLYAIGVGAGQDDAFAELAFTTENTAGVALRMLPAYAVVVVQNAVTARPAFGDIDRTKLVHAEQGFVLHRPLPVEGRARVTGKVTAIQDKGSGALVTMDAEVVDAATGAPLATATSSVFIRGEGGFGGERTPSPPSRIPERAPDFERVVATRPDQALLYRLSGDRNPLHSDPDFAARGGFSRPILHGMCTYGITGRILLNRFCDGDPDRLRSMQGRFTRPVLPGDTLKVQAWQEADGIRFRTLAENGQPVLDQGLIGLAP